MSGNNISGQIFGIRKENNIKTGNFYLSVREDTLNSEDEYKKNKKKIRRRIRLGSNYYKEGRWTSDEHAKFVKSCLVNGNNWRQVQKDVQTRTSAQIRSHAQKFVIRLYRKYSLKWNRRSNIDNKNVTAKITISSLDVMEEEDKKILEMFNCFKGSYMPDRLSVESSFKKKQKKILENIKKSRKKLIFKIEKIKKNKINAPLFDINDGNFQNDFEIFNYQIVNLLKMNEKIILKTFESYDVEKNKENLLTWVESNMHFQKDALLFNLQPIPMIEKMNEILNKWNS